MRTLKFFVGVLIFLCLSYSGAWFFAAHKINTEFDRFYNIDGPAQGIQFYGEQPQVQGFPFKPKIIYSKGLRLQNTDIHFEKVVIKAFPIPSLPLNINFTDGLSIKESNETLSVNYADAEFKIPSSFPKSTRHNDIKNWQEDVGTIKLTDLNIKYQDLILSSKGNLGLDKNLQFDVNINSNVYGYESLIKTLIAMDIIKPFVGALTLSGMNGMALTDEGSGQKYVNIDFNIQDQKAALGPIKLGNLPPINWQ